MNYRGYVLVRGWQTGTAVYFNGEFIHTFPSDSSARVAIDRWLYAP